MQTIAPSSASRASVSLTRSHTSRRALSVRAQSGQINPSIKKDVDKVADFVKVEELPKKAVFCRCWRSSKFPYCDGAHVKHNKETGDNVGPLIVEKAE